MTPGVAALAAASPILVVLVLMLGLRWSAARAGLVGVAVALAVAVGGFGFPRHAGATLALAPAVGGVAAESAFTALTILWIIGPALGIHHLQLRTGAAEVLRTALGAVAPDPRLLALLVAWFFVLLVEGAAGFGAPVALAAPFLVAAGFRPVPAVCMALVGHAVGVSFGAVGTPIVPQVAATGLTGRELARATGIYHTLLGWVPLVALVLLARQATPGDTPARTPWPWAAAAFAAFVVPFTLLWRYVGPELPTVGGALVGGALFVLLLRGGVGRAADRPAPAPVTAAAVFRAAAPYLALVALVLVTRLAAPLRATLQAAALRWELFGVFAGAMAPLYHPGTMLLVAFVAGAVAQRASPSVTAGAAADATRRLVPVAVALLAMLMLSRVMVHAGMTQALAAAAARGAGGAWPALAPFVGVLGTFVTGSATASNILFTEFQRETAAALSLPVAGVVGVQGFGAAVGNLVCPHNVVAAGATVGLEGREGEILRRTLPVTLVYAGLGGLVALWLVR